MLLTELCEASYSESGILFLIKKGIPMSSVEVLLRLNFQRLSVSVADYVSESVRMLTLLERLFVDSFAGNSCR